MAKGRRLFRGGGAAGVCPAQGADADPGAPEGNGSGASGGAGIGGAVGPAWTDTGAGNGLPDALAGGRFAKHFQQKVAEAGFIVEHAAHARPSLIGGVDGLPTCSAIPGPSGGGSWVLSADPQVSRSSDPPADPMDYK